MLHHTLLVVPFLLATDPHTPTWSLSTYNVLHVEVGGLQLTLPLALAEGLGQLLGTRAE